MPEKGWKSISVRDAVFDKLKKKAEKEHRTVTNMAEVIILEATAIIMRATVIPEDAKHPRVISDGY